MRPTGDELVRAVMTWTSAKTDLIMESLFIRQPRWLDRKLRTAAKRCGITPQDFIRYLLASALDDQSTIVDRDWYAFRIDPFRTIS